MAGMSSAGAGGQLVRTCGSRLYTDSTWESVRCPGLPRSRSDKALRSSLSLCLERAPGQAGCTSLRKRRAGVASCPTAQLLWNGQHQAQPTQGRARASTGLRGWARDLPAASGAGTPGFSSPLLTLRVLQTAEGRKERLCWKGELGRLGGSVAGRKSPG